PLVKIVVAGHVERRLPPPVEVAGRGGEARANGMADEQMIDRQGAADVEQRPALEAAEVERRTRRIAHRPAAQPVVDPAATIEMGEEGNRIAEEPRSRPGNRGEDGKTNHRTHLTKYAPNSTRLPMTATQLTLLLQNFLLISCSGLDAHDESGMQPCITVPVRYPPRLIPDLAWPRPATP